MSRTTSRTASSFWYRLRVRVRPLRCFRHYTRRRSLGSEILGLLYLVGLCIGDKSVVCHPSERRYTGAAAIGCSRDVSEVGKVVRRRRCLYR